MENMKKQALTDEEKQEIINWDKRTAIKYSYANRIIKQIEEDYADDPTAMDTKDLALDCARGKKNLSPDAVYMYAITI